MTKKSLLHVIGMVIPFILMGLVLFSPLAHAQSSSGNNNPVININIDVQGIIYSINGMAGNLGNTITSIPTQVASVFTGAIHGSLISLNNPLLNLSQTLLTTNPDPSGLYSWWQSMVLVISSCYLLLFLGIGFMFLFSSLNPEKRATAKEWLKNAFMMIVLVNISYYIYVLILQLATAITQYLWTTSFLNFFDPNMFNSMGSITLIVYAIAVILSAITIFIRHVFLLIGVVLFPLGLFLYFIPPLQNWGRMTFNLIGIALFTQFIDVILFVASNHIMLNLAGNSGASFVPALAFMLIFIVNVLLMIYAVLKSAFSIADNSRVISIAFGALTGQITSVLSSLRPTPQPQETGKYRRNDYGL